MKKLFLILFTLIVIAGIVLFLSADTLRYNFTKNALENHYDPGWLEEDGQIRVHFCGTGSPKRHSKRNQSCIVMAAGGKVFVFDAGAGAFRGIEQAGVPLDRVDQVFITHWHSDHFNGLGALMNYTWVSGRKTPFWVHGPEGVRQITEGFNQAYELDSRYRNSHFIEHRDLAFGKPDPVTFEADTNSTVVYNEGGVTIRAWKVNHFPVTPAVGYQLQYNGKTVFYSGDTIVDDIYQPAVQGADLVIHEAMAKHLVEDARRVAEQEGWPRRAAMLKGVQQYHSGTLEVAAMAEKAGVKKLTLTHTAPEPNGLLLSFLFKQGIAKRYSGELYLAEDGMDLIL
ncbi:MBL fold metallo-hydrolase [Alcanivoracaceae bacterium MT1]